MSDECPKCKCPAGIPAWVLTFADLMSLLMCFFVLLLSFAEMDVKKYKQIAGSMKMAFGVQRDITAEQIPKGINIIAKEFSPSPPQPTVINEVRQVTTNENNQEVLLVKKIEGLEEEQADLTKKLGKAETEEEREEIQEKIKKVEEEITEAKEELDQIQQLIDQIQQAEIQEQAMEVATALRQEIEEDILEIETNQDSFLIRIKDKGAFAAGSAELTDDFIDVLEVIKEELSQVKGAIIVAGHTDDIPIHTGAFRSNWDLSSERAVSVVQELLYESEITNDRISVQAFADTRPLVTNDTAENRSQNRRVEIIVSKSKRELNSLDEKENKLDKPKKESKQTDSKQTNRSASKNETSTVDNKPDNNKNAADNKPANQAINIERPEPRVDETNEKTPPEENNTPSFINF